VSEYPTTWDDYIGQAKAKRALRIAAESARLRDVPMCHVLITCPDGGVGKTALATLVAMQLGSRLETISEPPDPTKFRSLILGMDDGDVLLIDELHRFAKVQYLHHLLQDGLVTGRDGVLEPAPAITVIGATTDVHDLHDTIVGRFQMRLDLEPYTTEEAVDIAKVMSRQIFDGLRFPDDPCLEDIVEATNHNPRAIKQLLSTIRDEALVGETEWEEGYGWVIESALDTCNLRRDGLRDEHLAYLLLLKRMNGQAGLVNLAKQLGGKKAVEKIERLLFARDLVEPTSSGRQLTADGRDRVRHESDTLAA
jgi:Holliday junction DNA helicase RuvB